MARKEFWFDLDRKRLIQIRVVFGKSGMGGEVGRVGLEGSVGLHRDAHVAVGLLGALALRLADIDLNLGEVRKQILRHLMPDQAARVVRVSCWVRVSLNHSLWLDPAVHQVLTNHTLCGPHKLTRLLGRLLGLKLKLSVH